MNTRYLPLFVLLIAPVWAGCGGETPSAEQAVQPPATPVTAEAQVAPPPTAETVAPPPTAETPPPPKPGKDRIVGKWQFSFEGDPKAKAEEAAKKKFPKDKDQAKRDAQLAKIADAAAGEWIEFADGYYVSHVTEKGKDKVILKVKYDVTKDDAGKISMKWTGKDEISKKEPKTKDEVAVTFTDDNTISLFAPDKQINLVFKRK